MRVTALPNRILPQRLFTILDEDCREVAEYASDTSHQALEQARGELGNHCRTAIRKELFVEFLGTKFKSANPKEENHHASRSRTPSRRAIKL